MRQAGKWIFIGLFFTAFVACGKEEADIPDQRADFYNYLNSHDLDTLEYHGVYRAFFNNEEVIRQAAPGITDSGTVAAWLGEKIAGNPLENANPDSLAAWGSRLKTLGTRTSAQAAELIGERPALDCGLRIAKQYSDSLADYGDSIRINAQKLSQDRSKLRAFSDSIAVRAQWIYATGIYMNEIPFIRPGTIRAGDEVHFYYTGYIFSTSGLQDANIFTSNIFPLGQEKAYLRPEPAVLRVGAGEMISGIDRGLQGDMKDNYFQLFLTSDLAYGDKGVGLVDGGTPVVFQIDIVDVIKQ